ncbi:hypothetical protein [Bacteroides acidifaciens]|uniref:hypothetical protein n=1 Tax=Bacteroides acidifaciens TaxID=85831 RepID=UPI0023C904D4|nr:hypothetical protein [Bacteroides acidifaciens]MDE6822694.1 hypothetical protein [Bacteroides acidifaciens]
MKELQDLQLSIPCIDELTTRKLIGGNGYGIEDDFNSSIMLPEVVNGIIIEFPTLPIF